VFLVVHESRVFGSPAHPLPLPLSSFIANGVLRQAAAFAVFAKLSPPLHNLPASLIPVSKPTLRLLGSFWRLQKLGSQENPLRGSAPFTTQALANLQGSLSRWDRYCTLGRRRITASWASVSRRLAYAKSHPTPPPLA